MRIPSKALLLSSLRPPWNPSGSQNSSGSSGGKAAPSGVCPCRAHRRSISTSGTQSAGTAGASSPSASATRHLLHALAFSSRKQSRMPQAAPAPSAASREGKGK